MKKFFAIAAALLIAVASFAQETNRDENGKLKYGGYETNGFWDNWTVGVGLGQNSVTIKPIYAPDKFFDGKLAGVGNPFEDGNGIAWGTELFAIKWIEPCYGVRFGWTGVQMVTPWDDAARNLNYIHVDIMWNICNAWWGYKEGRKFEVSPYLSLAPFMRSVDLPAAGAGAGIFANYHFNDTWGIYAELGGILTNHVITGDPTIDGTVNIWKSQIGLTRNFGKSNWTRTATSAAAAAAAIAAAQKAADAKAAAAKKAADDAVAAAQTAKEEAKQLADEAAKSASANVDDLFNEPVVVYFEIGKSTLSKAEKAHAEYAIKNIISRGSNVKFTLNGSADTGTGSKKRNKQLSEERAKTVYNLVDALGVSRDNITVVEWDGTERFATPELNRAVIIEKQ